MNSFSFQRSLMLFVLAGVAMTTAGRCCDMRSAGAGDSLAPVPTPSQLRWQNAEMAMFIHFGINTFTNKEWGTGAEDPALFNPRRLDARQWIAVAKEAGFRYVILTAKHHDGFCLWPSAYTDHSVKNSPYRNGKGDVVREFAEACRDAGIEMGIYLSPWDRHEKSYGTDAYNDYFCNQLTELLTRYGDVGEVWFDGANGEGPNGKKQVYDWRRYYETVRRLQPNAVIAVHGPDVRWVGNEDGRGNETEWCVQLSDSIKHGASGRKVWYPSECDVSIRPGWFHHSAEDSSVKSAAELLRIYFESVGRNSNLLLNVPPNADGLISPIDREHLRGWKALRDSVFHENVCAGADAYTDGDSSRLKHKAIDDDRRSSWIPGTQDGRGQLTVTLRRPSAVGVVAIEEVIEQGQRVAAFSVHGEVNGVWKKLASGTTVGRSRILSIPPVTVTRLRLSIDSALAPPAIRKFGAYRIFP